MATRLEKYTHTIKSMLSSIDKIVPNDKIFNDIYYDIRTTNEDIYSEMDFDEFSKVNRYYDDELASIFEMIELGAQLLVSAELKMSELNDTLEKRGTEHDVKY